MISNSNEIYSDQYESILILNKKRNLSLRNKNFLGENQNIQLVYQLDENEKLKSENINNLEELLRKSRQLNSSKSLRLIDQQIENLPTNKNQSIESLILSCNKLGEKNQIDWTRLPNNLQVFDLISK
jgi:hypothetical protein